MLKSIRQNKDVESRGIQRIALWLLVGYALQFIFGMTVNLFTTFPTQHPGMGSVEYFGGALRGLLWALDGGGGWALATHAYIALALIVGAGVLLVVSIWLRSKRWVITSTIALLFTVGAFFNGLSFINYNHDFSSMIMACCWLIAVGTIVFTLLYPSIKKN